VEEKLFQFREEFDEVGDEDIDENYVIEL